MTPVTIVHTSVASCVPANTQVSGSLWNFFSIIHKIHRVWRLYNKAQIYSNPNNFYALVAGHVVNFVFGDSILLRIAAQCVMIASRILKCVDQTVVLAKKARRFVNVCKGTAYSNRSVKKTEGIYAKAAQNSFKQSMTAVGARVKAIAIALFKLLKQVFVLSMHFMDAIESFSMSPSTRNESINELFLNGTSFLDDLVKNQQRLLDCLQENRLMIDSVLKGIGPSVITADSLIDTVSKSAGVASAVHKGLNAGGGIVKNVLGHMLVGAAALVHQHKNIPKSLLPDDEALFSQKAARTSPTQWKRPLSNQTHARLNSRSISSMPKSG